MPSARACGRRMAGAVALAAVLTGGAPAAEDAAARVILYTRDTLTVRVTGVPTSEVLEELSRQSGADIRGQVREPRDPFPGSLPALIDRHPPVAVAGALADAIGSPSATLRQLIDLSLHHEDPAVRAEALRTGVATLTSPVGAIRLLLWKLETLVVPGTPVFDVGVLENSDVSPPATEAIVTRFGS